MRTLMLPWLAVFLVGCLQQAPVAAPPASPASTPAGDQPAIDVYFSPGGGCTDAVVREISAAKESVLMQAYSFTSAPIAKALVDAHKRGVKVAVILDKSQRTEKYSEADFLANTGIRTLIDAKHAIAHNKVMILDGNTVITGSFNFTKAAEQSNAENLLVIRGPAIAAKYTANWKAHETHSEEFQPRTRGYSEMRPAGSKQPDQSPKGEAIFVASANSKVFHRAGCPSAEKISAKNILQFATRDEAIRSGRKPCADCTP